MGWAGDTRESEERRLARSPVVLRCSSLATAAATPRRTARSRSGRSNMWDAFVWRMYLCWRHAGCINSPRGHSLGAMGGEGGSSESVESALENMSTNPRRPASCFSSFPPLGHTSHHTVCPPPCLPSTAHTPPHNHSQLQNTPPTRPCMRKQTAQPTQPAPSLPQIKKSRRSASASIRVSSLQREAGPSGDVHRPHSPSRKNKSIPIPKTRRGQENSAW